MGRETIDSQHMIDIRKFRSRWCLKSSSSYWTIQRSRNWTKTGVVAFTTCIWEDTSSLVIDFTATNNRTKEEKKYEIHINLAKKECNYWWYRYLFICPNCFRKYLLLYMHSDLHFYCRKCLNLCYANQLESKSMRWLANIAPMTDKSEKLYKTIKYHYRNDKMTRKYLQCLKLNEKVSRKLKDFSYALSMLNKTKDI